MEIRRSLSGLAMVVLLVGCEDDRKLKKTPASVLDTCTPAWSVVTPLNDNILTMPTSMVWSEGQLYLASTLAIATMPTEGGPITTLVSEPFAYSLWLEGDDLIYSTYKQLVRVPRAGGTPVPLLELPNREVNGIRVSGNGFMATDALDQDAYYWVTDTLDGTSLSFWRASRATGAVDKLVSPPVIGRNMAIALTPLGMLVTGQTQSYTYEHQFDAFVLPLNGDSPRPLNTQDPIFIVASVDATGMVWHRYAETDHLWFSPVDGSPERAIAKELPDFFIVGWSAPDGEGGRYLLGDELFEGGTTHGSSFHVDAEGYARRLACNPVNDYFFITSWAMAPDAIYFTQGTWDGLGSSPSDGWKIYRIPR
jgi:hypothetical protein